METESAFAYWKVVNLNYEISQYQFPKLPTYQITHLPNSSLVSGLLGQLDLGAFQFLLDPR
jgi:hypothetical protein